MHAAMWISGASFPTDSPEAMVSGSVMNLMNRTRALRNPGSSKPPRIVLISGIPDPAALWVVCRMIWRAEQARRTDRSE